MEQLAPILPILISVLIIFALYPTEWLVNKYEKNLNRINTAIYFIKNGYLPKECRPILEHHIAPVRYDIKEFVAEDTVHNPEIPEKYIKEGLARMFLPKIESDLKMEMLGHGMMGERKYRATFKFLERR